jgi:amino acid adenylation domain-containing protein
MASHRHHSFVHSLRGARMGKWTRFVMPELPGDNSQLSPAALAAAMAVCLSQYGANRTVRLRVRHVSPQGCIERLIEADASPDVSFGDLVQSIAVQLDDSCPSTTADAEFFVLVHDGVIFPGLHYAPQASPDALLGAEVERRGGGFRITIHYRRPGCPEWLAKTFGHHLGDVIRNDLRDPARTIAAIALMTTEESSAILQHSSGPRRSYPLDVPLFARFCQRAASAPDRIALIGEREDGSPVAMTYEEVAWRAESLKRRLRDAGARPGAAIGVYLERSVESAIALLAVLAAGGVYVPLDSSYPEDYLHFILADTQARFLVKGASSRLRTTPETRHVEAAERNEYVPGWQPPELADLPPTGKPCLIFYTSGSTGRPKGVVHSQQQVINRLHWMWETYPFEPSDRLAQRSPVSVMPSMWEMLGGLLAGTPTVTVPDRAVRDPKSLAEYLARHNVTFITMTPTLLRLMLDAESVSAAWPHSLRCVVIGGESLTQGVYDRFRQRFPSTTMVNDFGATEVNTFLHAPFRPGRDAWVERCNYRPIANVSAYILTDDLRLAPIGVEGELAVAGVCLATSYFGLPDITASRFIETKAGGDGSSERIYRTGDMAYMTPDGAIHVTGRRDHQVKINGFRVELGEVERTLSEHPAVAQCAVVDSPTVADRRVLQAWATAKPGSSVEAETLRKFVASRLPAQMVPAGVHVVPALARLPNGKIDRLTLRSLSENANGAPIGSDCETRLRQIAARILGVTEAEIDPDREFEALGFDSVAIVDFAHAVSSELGKSIPPTLLFECPTLHLLVDHLALGTEPPAPAEPPRDQLVERYAIIGMSCRFAGARSVAEFWTNLANGVESVGDAFPEALDDASAYGVRSPEPWHAADARCGFIPGADEFDPTFFGLTAAEACRMDPQQRVCLTEGWHALEDSGYTGSRLQEATVGVFLGARDMGYVALSATAPDAAADAILGKDVSLNAARLSYFCNLRGPSLTLDTACSSSLVAVHLACRSLAVGECDVALAGGVSITPDPAFYRATKNLNVLSPTGHTRSFDADADGFVHAEGVGFVVIKPLARALAARDRIYAVILGTAVNQDGRSNGIAAPNAESQSRLQEDLYRRISINPETITYVEAHGTGTKLGDPIEIAALTRSFAKFTTQKQFCAIGSVKTNIGHATAAAGIAGLIKLALCLDRRLLPPSLHYRTPNPWIDFVNSPFYVNTTARQWTSVPGAPRRGAINSFGMGGTNAHCVLEEAPPVDLPDTPHKPAYLVPITAANESGLKLVAEVLRAWLRREATQEALRDISWSLLVGRRLFATGFLLEARDKSDLIERLGDIIEGRAPEGRLELDVAPSDAKRPTNGAPVAQQIARGWHGDWSALYRGEAVRFISLPGYPFSQERFWIDSQRRLDLSAAPSPVLQRASTRELLLALVADVLTTEVGKIPIDRSLPELGFDSLRALSLKQSLDSRLGADTPVQLLLDNITIAELAHRLTSAAGSSSGEKPRGSPAYKTFGDPNELFPLTDLQAAYFVARHMPDADSCGCHNYLEFPVEDLSMDQLERAWARLVERHPMLRARIEASGQQRIPKDTPASFIAREDQRTLTPEERQIRLAAIREEMSHRRYKTGESPLYEIRVSLLPANRARIHVSMDSWIVDGASATVLYREWRYLYEKPDAELAPVRGTFRDFVLSMKAWEASPGRRESVSYWENKLKDCPPAPRLPWKTGPKKLAGRRCRIECVFGSGELACLRQTASEASISIGVLLLGTHIEALKASGAGERFPLMLTVSNREFAPSCAATVGPFNSTAVFIAEQMAGKPFTERLRAHRAQLACDLDNAYVSGISALRGAAPGRRAAGLPVVFSSTLGQADEQERPPTWLDDVDYAISQTPGVDLHMQAYERRDGLHIAWDYVEEHLEAGAVAALFESVRVLIAGISREGLSEPTVLLERASFEKRRRLVAAADTHGELTLSPLQEGLLAYRLMDADAPGATVYREFDITSFSAARLETALNEMLDAAAYLRSPISVARRTLTEFDRAFYRLRMEDLSPLTAARGRTRLRAIQSEMEAELRSNAHWPGFAVRASLLGDEVVRIHILLDQLVFDGHSVWLFYCDLFTRYREGGGPATTATIYRAFAAARTQYRETDAYALDRFYWSQKFAPMVPGPKWMGEIASGPPTHRRWSFEVANWRELCAIAETQDLKPLAVLITVYAEALRRWYGQERPPIVVASYGQAKLAEGLDLEYGDFTSLSWISPDASASTVAASARKASETLLRDRIHEWGNPLEALRAANLRNGGRLAFPAALTDFLDVPTPELPGLTEAFVVASTPSVDIDQTVRLRDGQLVCAWQVRTDRIPEAIVEAMVDDYRRMLEGLAGDAAAWHRPPTTGPHTAVANRELEEWNRTDAPYERDQRLHQLVERQVRLRPSAVALIDDREAVTYAEMDARANRLSRMLRERGVERGMRIAVVVDRSTDMVVSMLAILKAGGAWVPVGATEPPPRLARMLEQAGVSLAITQRAHRSRLSDGQVMLLLDEGSGAIGAQLSSPLPDEEGNSDDLAYVIFTSGSTGDPKGVMVRHKPLVNLIEWAIKTFSFSPSDRVLFVNSLGFDLSVFDVFGLLACGGSIRIVSETERMEAAHVATLLREGGITFWNSAPAYLQFVLSASRHSGAADHKLRLAFLSGDWIPLHLPDALRLAFPGSAVVGLGGATEAVVWSNYFSIGEIADDWKSIPYGKPIQNARYYLLDERLHPVARGTAGRLFIGGECLSDGYINAPELTAQRFLPDPFHELPGMKMYDTGDLARILNDGNMEFLGRADGQLKIRGFRIEPEEIESALARAGMVSPVVVAREETPGNRRIVGFGCLPGFRGRVTDELLNQRLAEQLPTHMVPAEIYALTSIPMTPNGKVDRRRLGEAPMKDLVENTLCPSAPVSADPELIGVIEFLRAALARILSVEPDVVQADTDFNSLGVNSLHFAQLCNHIAESGRDVVSLAKIFHCGSVVELAAALQPPAPEEQPGPASLEVGVPRAPRPAGTPFELAIIGLDCVVPGAPNADEFFENLRQGREAIGLIPPDRWDWRNYCGHNSRDKTRTANRAGFIADIDCFDAAFFSISPREAELMDPRQRLVLESVWRTLENAGHRPSEFRGQRVGVFIGALGDEYASLLRQAGRVADPFLLTGVARSLIANRVSYYFGWHGPSEVVDTTCSSSLVALHNAARAIETGDCSIAVAGGVNILIDPEPHLNLADAGILSPDGECRTFSADANGYVRGEGIGLVLLRPLADAIADGDNIYAVLSGSAVNHGGKSNALTAPDCRKQAQVIADAHRRSGIHPDAIGYVEAHGTGTPLGDPIEVEGLKRAFSMLYQDRNRPLPSEKRIRLGSVKTCIGHLEGAAGISGVIATALMLQTQTLPPLARLKTINPQIDMKDTPFLLHREARDWKTPLTEDGCPLPRAAGVSSFGFGGVNAHVVLREYIPPVQNSDPVRGEPVAIPLSARTPEQLAQYAARLREAIASCKSRPTFDSVAYTLRVGREPFMERAAIVAASLDELEQAIESVARGDRARTNTFYGTVLRDSKSAQATSGEALRSLSAWELAQAWTRGEAVDWQQFYGDRRPRRTPLPTYPFARARHWAPVLDRAAQEASAIELTGQEAYLEGHRIHGEPTLAAAAYIEFAARLSTQLQAEKGIALSGITWMRPLRFHGPEPVLLHASVVGTGCKKRVTFVSDEPSGPVEHCSAELGPVDATPDPAGVDINALKRCASKHYVGAECYRRLRTLGIALGPFLQVVKDMWWEPTGALARIDLSSVTGEHSDDIALLDGVFQAVAMHQAMAETERAAAHVPFSARRVQFFGGLQHARYARAELTHQGSRGRGIRRYDMKLLAGDGRVLLAIRDCTGMPLKAPPQDSGSRIAVFHEAVRPAVKETQLTAPLAVACHVTIGMPKFAEALARSGQRVLANAVVPGRESTAEGCGGAIPWSSLLESAAGFGDLILWFDVRSIAQLSSNEQLRFGFDTVFELCQYLICRRDLKQARIALCMADSSKAPALEALSGFIRTIQRENPKLRMKVVRLLDAPEASLMSQAGSLARTIVGLLNTAASSIEHCLDVATGARSECVLERVPVPGRPKEPVIRKGGVYLIAGGAGGIGRHLARALAREGARVALLGRSAQVSETDGMGDSSTARYFECDITDAHALRRTLRDVRELGGELRGVIHCAGAVKSGLLLPRSLHTARSVVSAKVQGALLLDEATAFEPLDFFALFSSLTSAIGPIGLSDYAYANRFLDRFADWRRALADRGERRGRTITVGWPVWADGGMQVPQAGVEELASDGFHPISVDDALDVFWRCLGAGDGYYLCGYGDPDRIERHLCQTAPPFAKGARRESPAIHATGLV